MTGSPLISIVTPSFNQGRYLRETLQSLVDQNYPHLEVIIQDGGSTDGAVEIAREFVRNHPKIFQLFVEKDSGQAEALNRGFARTRGEILGFLNSDDTLYAGALHGVVREIDPARNRFIVMGRCLFTGEDSVYVGVEHPALFSSHFEQLAIWKRGHNTIPQPSVFWHRQVWQHCGGLDVNENHALDYDLFCRFSQRYRFHFVDELWSTYRMHAVSKSFQRTESEILELSIRVSKRYWGSWFGLLRWKCEFSYWQYRRHNHELARHHARRCEEAAEAQHSAKAFGEFLLTACYSPKMARDRLLVPYAAAKQLHLLYRLIIDSKKHFTGRYDADLWIGPLYRNDLTVPKDARRLLLILQHSPQNEGHNAVSVIFRLNNKKMAERRFSIPGQYMVELDLRDVQGHRCVLEMKSDSFFVPRFVHNVPDDRLLSIQLVETKIDTVKDEYHDREGREGWIGPLYRREFVVPEQGHNLEILIEHSPEESDQPAMEVAIHVDQDAAISKRFTTAGRYIIELDVRKFRGRNVVFEMRSDRYFTPVSSSKAGGNRKRSIKVIEETISTEEVFRDLYEGDSYISPDYRQQVLIASNATRLVMVFKHTPQGERYRAAKVSLVINQKVVAETQCTEPGQYTLEGDLSKLRGQSCIIELRSDNYFIPHEVHSVPDYRKLSVQLLSMRGE